MLTRPQLLHPKYIPVFKQAQRVESYNLIQRVIDALESPGIAVDDKHGPKLYSRLLKGLLATVKLDAPYPGRTGTSHTRKPSSRTSSSLGSGSPGRSSISPVRLGATHLNSSQIHHIQADEGQNSPVDGPSGDSPSSMQGLNVQEFFSPPLPFDGELLHSMQNLTNSTEWDGMALPGVQCSSKVNVLPILTVPTMSSGWNWMDGLQPSGDMQGILQPGSCPAPDIFATGDFSTFPRF